MPRVMCIRTPKKSGIGVTVALVATVLTLSIDVHADGGGLEPFTPATDQLRHTILDVVQRQALRPPAGLPQPAQDALRSIAEIEGRSNSRLARHLSAHITSAWIELERSRIASELGYIEFDEATFRASEAQFQAIIAQYSGVRVRYSKTRNQAAIKALTDIRTLSRAARRNLPGLWIDDVQLAQEKRWDHLWKGVREEPLMERSPLTPRR